MWIGLLPNVNGANRTPGLAERTSKDLATMIPVGIDNHTALVIAMELRFFDESLGFAELETGGSTVAIAAHSLTDVQILKDEFTVSTAVHSFGNIICRL